MAIIKCPECGGEVSTSAEQCPHCGVKIAGNIKTCPDCGKVLLKNADRCPSCGAILIDNNPSTSASVQSSQAATDSHTPQPQQPHKKSRAWIGILIAAVVLIILGVAYYIYTDFSSTAKEQQEYEQVINSNDTTLCNQYLADFPNGEHADEVKARLTKLVTELRDWHDACVNNSKNGYVNFLAQHPGSPFEKNCKIKIDSLDFQDAVVANTADAYQRYIDEHSDGQYVEQASTAINNINALKVQPDETQEVKEVCNEFFNALGSKDESTLTSTVAAVMDNFLNKKQANHSDVMTFANKIFQSDIESMNFTIGGDYKIHKTPINNDEYVYDVSFSVDQNINRSDAGKDVFVSYIVTARVNQQLKITSLTMRRVAEKKKE